MKKHPRVFLFFAIILVAAVAFLSLNNQLFQPMVRVGPGRAPMIREFEALRSQASSETPEGKFGILAQITTPEGVFFFYEMKSDQSGPPQFSAFSSYAMADEEVSDSLSILKQQELGELADFNVGIVLVQLRDQPNQKISLRAAPAGTDKAKIIWQVTTLQQSKINLSTHTYISYDFRGSPSGLTCDINSLGGGADSYGTFRFLPPPQSTLSPLKFLLARSGVAYPVT